MKNLVGLLIVSFSLNFCFAQKNKLKINSDKMAMQKIKLKQKTFDRNLVFQINDSVSVITNRDAFYEYYTRGRDVSTACADFLQLLKSNEKTISSTIIPSDKNSVCMVFTAVFLREQFDKGNIVLEVGKQKNKIGSIVVRNRASYPGCDTNADYFWDENSTSPFYVYETMCRLQ